MGVGSICADSLSVSQLSTTSKPQFNKNISLQLNINHISAASSSVSSPPSSVSIHKKVKIIKPSVKLHICSFGVDRPLVRIKYMFPDGSKIDCSEKVLVRIHSVLHSQPVSFAVFDHAPLKRMFNIYVNRLFGSAFRDENSLFLAKRFCVKLPNGNGKIELKFINPKKSLREFTEVLNQNGTVDLHFLPSATAETQDNARSTTTTESMSRDAFLQFLRCRADDKRNDHAAAIASLPFSEDIRHFCYSYFLAIFNFVIIQF